MLERFRKAKQAEIDDLRRRAEAGTMPQPLGGVRPGFMASLQTAPGVAVIAEYKRASPSRGDINLAAAPEQVAAGYAAAGARAVSVLTEETYFKGSLEFLHCMAGARLPLLRKDFIFDSLQVDATAATPASAVLLIVRMLEQTALVDLLARCARHSLEAVVEVFDAHDMERAQEAGARLIQVNNRDLDTLAVDFAVSRALASKKRPGECWIAASGIETGRDARALVDLGFDALLVGTSLMRGGDPGAGLAALIREANRA